MAHASGEFAVQEHEAPRRSEAAASPLATALAVAVLLPVYLGLTLAFRDSVPLFEAPDEPSHLHYAAFVYAEKRLPRKQPTEVPGQGMRPPLVYLLAAPLLGQSTLDLPRTLESLDAVGRQVYYPSTTTAVPTALRIAPSAHRRFTSDGSLAELGILRGVSLVFGMLAVIFTFAAVWRVGRDARLGLLAAGILAFNPRFLFGSATFSNDAASAMIGAATLWIVLRALEEGGPSRTHYLLGAVAIAAGFLTELSTFPGLAAAALTLALLDRRPASDRRIDTLLAVATFALLAGPYILWSAIYRGGVLGLDAVGTYMVNLPRVEEVGGPIAYLAGPYWERMFHSYWSRFGWQPFPSGGVILATFTLTWTGLLGWFAGRVPEANALLRSDGLRAYLMLAIGLTLLVHVISNTVIVTGGDQLLFSIAPHFSLLLALGLGRLLGFGNRTLPLTVIVIAGLILLDLYCLRAVILPAYLAAP